MNEKPGWKSGKTPPLQEYGAYSNFSFERERVRGGGMQLVPTFGVMVDKVIALNENEVVTEVLGNTEEELRLKFLCNKMFGPLNLPIALDEIPAEHEAKFEKEWAERKKKKD
jgi:hypothetical protein